MAIISAELLPVFLDVRKTSTAFGARIKSQPGTFAIFKCVVTRSVVICDILKKIAFGSRRTVIVSGWAPAV